MSLNAYTRREILASGLAVLATGCVRPGFDGVGDDDCTPEYHARADVFDPATELPPDYGPRQRALARRAIRHGRATAVYGPRPLKRDSFVVDDGAYYRVSHVEDRTTDLPALVLSVGWVVGRTPPANAAVSEFPDLPSADRVALRSVVYGGIYREAVHPTTTLVHAESPVPYPDGTGSSVLATRDTCWIRWNGRAYDVTLHRETTAETLVHEYEATQVAADAAAFRGLIADEYLVELADLTPEERSVLDAAVDGGYDARGPSPGFERLVARLPETTVPGSGGLWYVEYDGDRYGLRLEWAGCPDTPAGTER